jgi:hypothetical protein
VYKKLVIASASIGAIALMVCLWPSPRVDPQRVLPSLRDLAKPYRSVRTGYYLDGGSIGVEILDRDGHRLALALPVGYDGIRRTYSRLLVGGMHASDTNAVEKPFTAETRKVLIGVIEQSGASTDDPSLDLALLYLRRSPRDYARICARAVANFGSHRVP